jgi:hypothetical protein
VARPTNTYATDLGAGRQAFWTECGQQKALCDTVAGFRDKIRDHIAFVVSATYQVCAPAIKLGFSLNAEGASPA